MMQERLFALSVRFDAAMALAHLLFHKDRFSLLLHRAIDEDATGSTSAFADFSQTYFEIMRLSPWSHRRIGQTLSVISDVASLCRRRGVFSTIRDADPGKGELPAGFSDVYKAIVSYIESRSFVEGCLAEVLSADRTQSVID